MRDVRTHDGIIVQSLDRSHWEEARALVNGALGAGYFESVDHDVCQGVWLAARADDDRLLGVARATLTPPCELAVDAAILERILASKTDRVGVLKTLVVSEAARGRGIGSRLTRERLQWLSGKARDAVTISWSEAAVAAKMLLTSCGFHEVARLAFPFAQDSVHHGIDCPACGSPPCACAGSLFWRSLDGLHVID